MDAGNPLLDDYVLAPDRGRAPEASASCPRRRATPTTTSCASTAPSRPSAASPATSRSSAATAPRRPATPASTCSRRTSIYVGGGIGHQPARRLARARDRRRAGRGVAARRRALRAERRLAVLVLRGGDRLPRRAAGGRGPRAAAALQLRALRRRAVPAPGVPALRARRHVRGLRGRRRRRAALRRHRPAPRGGLAARQARLARRAARRSRGRAQAADRRPRRTAGARAREDHPRAGRRWLHRRRRATRALDELVLQLAGAPGAADPLPAHGQRRPARPDRALPRRLRRPAVRARGALALPHGRPAPAAARGGPLPGRHLRRRRLDAQPAGHLAGPRPRPDAARRVGARRRARRAQRRGHVLAARAA